MAVRTPRLLQIVAYIMLTAIFIFAIAAARDCARVPASPVEGFSAGDTLDIALIYAPGSFYMYEDSLAGINKSVAAEFSSQTNRPVKFWPITDPASGIAKLENGAFDIVASLPLDNSLKKRFIVSESIFLDRLVLVQLTDSSSGEKAVNSSLQLNGKEIHVAAGSSALNRLKNLEAEIGGNIAILEEPELSDELICLQVAASSIQLAVVNERVARQIAESYPFLKYDSSVSFTQFQVWIFNPSDSILARSFNDWFETFRSTETYREIIERF